MTTKTDVIDYLWKIEDKEEITELWEILRTRSGQIEERTASVFSVGDTVEWKGKGRKVRGKITKINRKSVCARDEVTGTLWRVSPSLLTKIS